MISLQNSRMSGRGTVMSAAHDGSRLILQADNDFDPNGLSLLDEFSDCTAAYIKELFDGEIRVESITQVSPEA